MARTTARLESTSGIGIEAGADAYAPASTFSRASVLSRRRGHCDFAGFNIARFDLPLLLAEFRRAACKFSLEGRMVFDAQAIFHRRKPRTPEAALLLYCGQELEGAHDALADVDASIEVIEGPFGHYVFRSL